MPHPRKEATPLHPFLILGPLRVPMYGLLIVVGAAAAFLFAGLRMKKRGLDGMDLVLFGVYALVGAAVGAKLTYALTRLKDVLSMDWTQPLAALSELFAGFVYYGGLIGGVGGAFLCKKLHHIALDRMANLILPGLPLAHAFGRVGCFMAGCCYGREMPPPLGIAFTEAIAAPNGVYLFPVQLVEAACNLVIFLILWRYTKEERPPYSAVALYLCLYAPLRFCLEYLRDDAIRGAFLSLSTSQWLSLALFAAGLIWLLLLRRPTHNKG